MSWEPPLSPNGVITGYQVVVTDLVLFNQSADLTSPLEWLLYISSGIGRLMVGVIFMYSTILNIIWGGGGCFIL